MLRSMGYEHATPLDETYWPVVHHTLASDAELALVTYGPRAMSLQWTDAPKSPHAEEVSVDFAEGRLLVVFHSGTRTQREGVLARLATSLAAAGARVAFEEA